MTTHRRPGEFSGQLILLIICAWLALNLCAASYAQDETACLDCHELPDHATFSEQLEQSVHSGWDCLTCHAGADVVPHEMGLEYARDAACRQCHVDVAEDYTRHGLLQPGDSPDVPLCADCHGSHGIVPTENPASLVHPKNQHESCVTCHGSEEFTKEHYLIKSRLEAYLNSVHGPRVSPDSVPAAACNDCHTNPENPHLVYGRRTEDSPILYFNISQTCGRCHGDVQERFDMGIHGLLTARGETDSPTCTSCHGEHDIMPTTDPDAPVSPTEVAGQTCAPCHESVLLNSRYGIEAGVVASFEDSYHGMKSAAGDTEVANCASCHGVHRILPEHDPRSRVHPSNLVETCGECHAGISPEMSQIPIHGANEDSPYHTRLADIIEDVYIIAIIVIIGLMVIHWLIDLGRHLVDHLKERPRVRRMTTNEVWMHMSLTISFIVLVVTGFALTYEEAWLATWLFGWEGGFAMRGVIHRIASVIFMITIVWHVVYTLWSPRGRQFFIDMMPRWDDFRFFFHQIGYNLRLRQEPPAAGRFTYIEKAEYWALVWGSVIMVVSGLVLWFDDYLIQVLPAGSMEIAWLVHFWEAWLATLAIGVWHLYSTIFKPEVYPMNPAWVTGYMPEELFKEEHPEEWEKLRAQNRGEVESTDSNAEAAAATDSADETDPEAGSESEPDRRNQGPDHEST